MTVELMELKDLTEKLGSTFEKFKKANDEELAKKANGEAVGELKQMTTKIETDLGKLEEKIEQVNAALKRRGSTKEDKDNEAQEAKAKYRDMFIAAIKGGDRVITEEAIKAAQAAYGNKSLRVESNPDGGFFVTPDMSSQIVERIFETSPIRQLANVSNTSKSSVEGKYDGEEPQAWWVGETQERNKSGTPQVGMWSIPIHELAAEPDSTQKNLDDSDLDIESWLAGKVASRMSRMENTAFILGDGNAKPRGILSYPATPGSDPYRDYERGTIVQINSTSAGTITYDDVINLETSLKSEYRNNANYLLNRVTLGIVRKLKDQEGQYLWQPSQQAGTPALLNNYTYALMEDMPDVATGTTPIGFGDIYETYTIKDRTGIRVLADPYTQKGFVLFYTTKRVGGGVTNFDSFKTTKVS